ILRAKLHHLEAWTEARRAHAALYDKLLEGSGVQPPAELPGRRHVYHVYAVRSRRRDALQRDLQELRIHTAIHYPVPVHLHEAYSDMGYQAGDFPCSEEAAGQVLSLPLYPEMSEVQVITVATAIRKTHER